MKCPECDGPTKVIDSRKKPEYLYRRRLCRACGARFSTKEVAFNIVLPSQKTKEDEEKAKELARLEELNKLINAQVKDAKRNQIQYGYSLDRHDYTKGKLI